MLQCDKQKVSPGTSNEVRNTIKQLLQYQRFAVSRAASIGMSADEAKAMQARIDEIGKLVERLPHLSS